MIYLLKINFFLNLKLNSGIILLISTFSHGTTPYIVAGIFVLFSTISFVFIAAADVLMLMKVYMKIK
jgi:hypothetical protein